MNYYPHHIGDFNSATRHLTRVERSIYRDLIELYYDTEQPLTLDRKALCRKVIARTDEEVTAVEQVLNEFFTETEQGWNHERCEREIQKYHGNIGAKSAAGRASAAKRAKKSSQNQHPFTETPTAVQQPFNECSTNHKPLTINQEPKETKTKARADGADVFPEIEDRQLVKDWLKVRKMKKLATTDTALEGFKREVERSGFSLETILRKCCEKGWGGFEAKWLESDYGPPKKVEKFDPIAYVNRFAKRPSEYDEKIIEH